MPGQLKNITIVGYNRLMNSLRRIAADNQEIGDEPVRAFSQEMRGVLKSEPYPPKRPGQRSVRTGRLANSWKVEGQGPPARYRIINTARSKKGKFYAGWVVGIKQAWMHKGRWWKAVAVVKKHSHKLSEKLNSIYKELWGK